MSVLGSILVDGVPYAEADATISVLDIGLQRGYGCFESVRSYAGKPFRLEHHIDRLESSARHHANTPPAACRSRRLGT